MCVYVCVRACERARVCVCVWVGVCVCACVSVYVPGFLCALVVIVLLKLAAVFVVFVLDIRPWPTR